MPGRGRGRLLPLGDQEHAEALERPSFPLAQAALAEHRQAPLQAAGSLLQTTLLTTDLAQAVHGARLGGAVAGGAGQGQARLQAALRILKASRCTVDVAEALEDIGLAMLVTAGPRQRQALLQAGDRLPEPGL